MNFPAILMENWGKASTGRWQGKYISEESKMRKTSFFYYFFPNWLKDTENYFREAINARFNKLIFRIRINRKYVNDRWDWVANIVTDTDSSPKTPSDWLQKCEQRT